MDHFPHIDVETHLRNIDGEIDGVIECVNEDMGAVAVDTELHRLLEVLAVASSNVLQYTRNVIQES